MSANPRLQLRPHIETQPSDSPEASFLHQTLRPVLKLQNDLLLRTTQHFLQKRKVKLVKMSPAQRDQQIQHSIGKDNRLRGLLFGCVLGQFTTEELDYYLANEGEINRRITQLLVQRLQTQMERLL
ncbi:MAG: hypothetical protein AAFP77_15550 [Bacteroidota bacterium]